ncbi:MAG TPA: hypothetical protein VFX70_09775, partial [Mycobacteriales bacterium]|nr:hypothetical protein [Mycobacteriales bacterium]
CWTGAPVRRAAAWWRAGDYRDAMATWRATGGVVTTETRAQALRAALTGWAADRAGYPDCHDRIDNALLLAVRNCDVAELNTAARALARATGDLTGPDRVYRLAAGATLPLAIGDVVMTRVNDYRARRDAGPDVLNGRRGYIDHIDPRTGEITVTWRSPDGIHRATVTADYVAAGGLEHGYAITVYKAQGHTAETTHTYGGGLDAHTTYVAQTRARHAATLYLPAAALADPTQHTPADIAAMTPNERADLAAWTVTHAAEHTTDQHLVTEELTHARPIRTRHTAATGPPGQGHPTTPAAPQVRHRRVYLAALDAGLRTRLDTDPALPTLLRTIDQIAGQGHDPARILAALAAGQDLDTAKSPARVLHWRAERWLDHHPTHGVHTSGRHVGPPGTDQTRPAAIHLPKARTQATHPAPPHVPEVTEPAPGTDSHPHRSDLEPEHHATAPEDTAEAT